MSLHLTCQDVMPCLCLQLRAARCLIGRSLGSEVTPSARSYRIATGRVASLPVQKTLLWREHKLIALNLATHGSISQCDADSNLPIRAARILSPAPYAGGISWGTFSPLPP